MRSPGMLRVALAAAASMSFAGAQKLDAKSLMSEQRAELAFDPNAVLRAASESSFGRQVAQLVRKVSGNKSRRARRHYQQSWLGAPNHRKTAREQRNERNFRNEGRVDYYSQRMAWLERNAHVIAKREADQARAMGPLGGRNRIMWGRR
jgi:hypothetical protein